MLCSYVVTPYAVFLDSLLCCTFLCLSFRYNTSRASLSRTCHTSLYREAGKALTLSLLQRAGLAPEYLRMFCALGTGLTSSQSQLYLRLSSFAFELLASQHPTSDPSSHQWFSNLNMLQNHLGGMLKDCWAPSTEFLIQEVQNVWGRGWLMNSHF